jgi:hypothetical protein
MTDEPNEWVLLIYRIPPHPTRLRLSVWRRLQKMGALYLQDAVCALPARADLTENMQYVAEAIAEAGGVCHLFSANTLLPGGGTQLVESFRALADARFSEIGERARGVEALLSAANSPEALEKAEEELKRERVAYLRARRLAYFGGGQEVQVEARLDALRAALDEIHRGK